jgi:GntR family transcriptional regulator, carbon starvation induced regulator
MNVQVPRLRKEFGKTVAADVAHRLREDIVSCRLMPGEPLKFEQLRTNFSVSFSTLREALMALVADGLVVAEGQRGFHVAPASLADLLDVTDVRVMVELEALRKSIARGDDEWEIGLMSALHRLNKAEERLEGPAGEDPKWRVAHSEFHEALIAACGSPVLMAMRASLFDRAERYRALSAARRPASRNKSGEHRAIMLAAVARNADEAAALVEQHIRDTAANVVRYAGDTLDKDED